MPNDVFYFYVPGRLFCQQINKLWKGLCYVMYSVFPWEMKHYRYVFGPNWVFGYLGKGCQVPEKPYESFLYWGEYWFFFPSFLRLPSVYPSMLSSIYPSIRPSVHLSTHRSVHLSIHSLCLESNLAIHSRLVKIFMHFFSLQEIFRK